jgi:hypothetical protein
VLPRPESGFEYELTEYGMDLEEAVLALGRWGARSLGDPRPDEIVTTDSLIIALRTTFQPAAAAGVHTGFEVRLGDVTIHAIVDGPNVTVADGPLEDADLVIEAGPGLRAVMAAELSPQDAVQLGHARLTGDPALFELFADLFKIGPVAARAS